MAKTFRPYEPDQELLMPPSLQDWDVRDLESVRDLSSLEALADLLPRDG